MTTLEQDLYEKIKRSYSVLKGQGIIFGLNDDATEIKEIVIYNESNSYCGGIHLLVRNRKPYATFHYFDDHAIYFFNGKTFKIRENFFDFNSPTEILTYEIKEEEKPLDLNLVREEFLKLAKFLGDS